MPGVDENREFVPLKIAVLTISDTRNLKDDKSGALLAQRIAAAGHLVAERSIVTDDIEAIRGRVKAVDRRSGRSMWSSPPAAPVLPAATSRRRRSSRCSKRRWTRFRRVPHGEPSQDRHVDDPARATAGIAGATYIFCLPGSPGACKDAWDGILVHQLDYRYGPCNFVEIMPRLDEHLRRPKAKGATV